MKLRTLIVDDEPPARAMIREYLEEFPDVEIVGECGNGRQAVEAIRARAPDLLFLDVQMPGLTGFDVLEALDTLPHVIFSTAYDAYALQAFDAGAVDYLLKPYTRERFRTAVERVRERLRRHETPSELLVLLEAARRPPAYPERLFVRHADGIVPVPVADIYWIEAAGDYSKLHTEGASHLCALGIGALEARLDPARFVRVHRSALIALDALERLASDGQGGYVARLRGGSRVRVSRSYAAVIRERIV